MMIGILIGVLVLEILLIVLDLTKVINLMHPIIMALYLPIATNIWLAYSYIYNNLPWDNSVKVSFLVVLSIFTFYLWVRINVFPVMDGKKVGFRLKAMIGGRTIMFCMMYTFVFEFIFIIIYGINGGFATEEVWFEITNFIYVAGMINVMFINGMLRIICTSRRLSIIRRLVVVLTLWIPFVNVIVWFYTCKLIRDEYDMEWNRIERRNIRVENEICKTKYPILLVHGVGFRDLRYFNYWGRIPNELLRHGAKLYYGNQEALGTTDYNSEDIKNKILEIVKETGCEKVNIIAHSKGGLDARYAISMRGMDKYVASLTTMNTPHRGCRFVDKACKLPDGLYRFIAKIFDTAFKRAGDKNSDFYTATRQFSTAFSEEFNKAVKDSNRVYYQSYTSIMKNMFSDSILWAPYLLIKSIDGANDGLVAIESAKWGNYKGLITSTTYHGISHGDMIDLRRADEKGYDIIEQYVNIVADLKNKGY